ncbi:MAG TPA: VOC family protein [Gaiellaceae bacterium]
MPRPRLVGINHVALEVDDVEAAVDFLGRIFELRSVSRVPGGAFVDIGDQFIALFERGEARHFGLVVDDKEAVRERLAQEGVEVFGRGLDFRDPSGNVIQIVQYDQVQFTKDERILRAMGLSAEKTEAALDELRAKGLGPDESQQ